MKGITNFFFELSVLKKLPRSGSFIAGVQNPDTVGEHVFRAAEIAFVLAEMEGGNGERSAFLALIHDNAETRIGDHHKIMARYIESEEAEERAFLEQSAQLPSPIQQKFLDAFTEWKEQKTREAVCARDADLLELALQSKEFLEHGYIGKSNWLENIEKMIKTSSAKNIFQEIKNGSCHDWWNGLKKIDPCS